MPQNFTTSIRFEGRRHLAVVVPMTRSNGLHFEVNIPGFPRFWLRWGTSDKYELVKPGDAKIPDGLLLAVSDAIEAAQG
ncbi:MAG: hypothetical protein JST06_06545 [Bacteroidetes bacterium]|nr:hypothetical protein [Bacteroidota bacterium]MBS1630397.1 hypothetical protein [Bacteroidota bacterium]